MVNYSIKAGFVTGAQDSIHRAGKQINGPFFLLKWLKSALTYLGVANADPCCLTSVKYPQDPLNLPMRYNKTAGKLQYLEPSTGVWTNLTTF